MFGFSSNGFELVYSWVVFSLSSLDLLKHLISFLFEEEFVDGQDGLIEKELRKLFGFIEFAEDDSYVRCMDRV
jgi:hypothetical protein